MTLSPKLATTRYLTPITETSLDHVAVNNLAAIPYPLLGASWGAPQVANAPAIYVAGRLLSPLDVYNLAYAAALRQTSCRMSRLHSN